MTESMLLLLCMLGEGGIGSHGYSQLPRAAPGRPLRGADDFVRFRLETF